jgi:hypothetical protein
VRYEGSKLEVVRAGRRMDWGGVQAGSDGVRLALGARGECIGPKEVTEGQIDAKVLV